MSEKDEEKEIVEPGGDEQEVIEPDPDAPPEEGGGGDGEDGKPEDGGEPKEDDKEPEPSAHDLMRKAVEDGIRTEREAAEKRAADERERKRAEEEAAKKAAKPEIDQIREEYAANEKQITMFERMLAGDTSIVVMVNGVERNIEQLDQQTEIDRVPYRVRIQNQILELSQEQKALLRRASDVKAREGAAAQAKHTTSVLNSAKELANLWIEADPTLKVLRSDLRTALMDMYAESADGLEGMTPDVLRVRALERAKKTFYEGRGVSVEKGKPAPKVDDAPPAAKAAAPAAKGAATNGFPRELAPKVAAMAKILGKAPGELTTNDVSVEDLKSWTP